MAFVRLTELFRYAAEPVGNVLTALAVVGSVWLWRSGQRHLVALLLGPIALNTVAWLLSSYPLEASRVVVYASPAALLLIAAGIPPALTWLSRWGKLAPLSVSVLLLVPVGLTARAVVQPWGRLDSATPTAFVLQHRLPTEPVVGTLWEQAYYCRELELYYRALAVQPTEPPSLPPTAALTEDRKLSGKAAASLWLLSSPEPAEQAAQLALLNPTGPWRIAEKQAFPDVVVLRLLRDIPSAVKHETR